MLFLLLLLLPNAWAQAAKMSDRELTAAISALLDQTYKPDQPGAAVIVVRDGQVVFRKGYGMASLELGVPIEPDMIFRIGSITKQFTAVATLMLAEQGKLSLSDEITRFLPDYPVNGKKITIEHLLTHTSGIKSYTSLPEWLPLWRKDLSLTELIALFKDKPLDFAPGESWSYNNSAYVLLGAIIEKASGQSYQDFIEQRIFAPLGMKHSFYDRTERVIPRRVAGYSKGKDGYVNCAYLSMTQPHAAGSLMSSVDDLALWDAALYTERVVKQESLKRAWTPYRLNNGRPTHYGYGWAMGEWEGHRFITHDGGINGFITSGYRFPDDKVYVAVLTNLDSPLANPGDLAFRIGTLTIGKPYRDPATISLTESQLDQYVGVYEGEDKKEVLVRRDGGRLMVSLGPAKIEIVPLSETEFAFKESMRNRVRFIRSGGRVTGLVRLESYGADQEFRRTERPLPATPAPKAAKVDPKIYDQYTGEYELAPGLTITVSRDGDKLMAVAAGQPKVELVPESATKFQVMDVGAQLEFVPDASGRAASIIFNQDGQQLKGKRIK
ncbi:MAG: serine hydrolase [Blastocatellia bacterium]